MYSSKLSKLLLKEPLKSLLVSELVEVLELLEAFVELEVLSVTEVCPSLAVVVLA